MKRKIFLAFIAASCLLIFSCKKDQQNSGISNSESTITGLWEVKLLTTTQYDANYNVIKIDTVIYTDELGEPVTLLEEFTSDNKFIVFKNSISDTLKQSTYTQSGNSVVIHMPDDEFPFNNRVISKVDSTALVFFQMFNNTSPKQKWIQTYIRK